MPKDDATFFVWKPPFNSLLWAHVRCTAADLNKDTCETNHSLTTPMSGLSHVCPRFEGFPRFYFHIMLCFEAKHVPERWACVWARFLRKWVYSQGNYCWTAWGKTFTVSPRGWEKEATKTLRPKMDRGNQKWRSKLVGHRKTFTTSPGG